MNFRPFDFKKDTVEGRMIARLEDALAELASKDELLRRAVKIFIFAVRGRPCSPSCPCDLCQIGRLARAFLTIPEVVKVMEKKP